MGIEENLLMSLLQTRQKMISPSFETVALLHQLVYLSDRD